MTSCLHRLAPGAMALALVASSAHAIVPHAPEGLAPEAAARLEAPPFVLPVVDADESKAWGESDPAFRAFVAEAGVAWRPRWDRRTGRLSFAWGSFPAWLPAGSRVSTPDERAVILARLDAECRALMQRHPGLLQVPQGVALELDGDRSVALDGGRVWQILYRPAVEGVRVEGGSVFFRVNSGRLIQLGQELVSDALLSVPKAPRISAAQAESAARAEVGALLGLADGAGIVTRDAARLAILPWAADPRGHDGAPGTGLTYHLAWRTASISPDRIETWEAWHDASSGERLALRDANHYACPPPATPQGRVIGGVYLGPIEEATEELRGMPYTLVQNGPPVTTDVNGVFPFNVGQTATTSLSGSFFDMNCVTCDTPAQAFASTSGWGYLSLGTGGNDVTGNGISTRAERNCFYHLNIVRQLAAKHLDDASATGFLSRNTPANVNFGFTCNAFWDGNSVNFFRAGGGCNNTGEIADVMQHEWGHGIDQFTGGGMDGARGEGIGDVVAFLSTHDARLGPYFVAGDPAGIRNADEAVVGVMTASNVGTFCPPDAGGGPLGFQVHCEGGIFVQTWWHLASNLRQKMVAAGGGEAAGWFLTEKLFYQSLPLSRTYVPAGPQSTYDAVVAVDDDDGDLTNGVPNGTEINAAFVHHEIAGTPPVGDSADCSAPITPGVSLSSAQHPSTGLWQVRITWTPVPGAVEYRVERNQAGGVGADEPLATVLAPGFEFFDDDVTDDVTYYYRVIAFAADGCTSIGDNVQSITIGALPNITLQSWSFDDTSNPGANDNGVAEPGELLVIPFAAANVGSSAATAVLAELTTAAPGVTIVRGSQVMGDMLAGAVRPSVAPHFAVQLDRTLVTCGSVIPFAVSFEATEGCSVSGFSLQVGALPAPCEPPDPRPRLRFDVLSFSDGLAEGGVGDASGYADPGESVRVPVDVTNLGNATATNVVGRLSLLAGPPGTSLTDADTPWIDIAPDASRRSSGAPAHVEVTIPADAVCGAVIDLMLVISYDGPSGTYTLDVPFPMLVGRLVDIPVSADWPDDFEIDDNGFTHDANCPQDSCDEWQRGLPNGDSPSDPTVAHSGTNVWGTDHGTGAWMGANGTYRRDTISWLSTPVIDATALAGGKLSFWRWLAVEDHEFDSAMVGICLDDPATAANPLPADAVTPPGEPRPWGGNCTSFTRLWNNPQGANHVDTAWTYQEFDISAIADGQPNVRVVFGMSADGGLQFGGWNIDDLNVFWREPQCANSCPAVGPPASPGGALRATGVKSQSSVEFDWPIAGALGPGESWKIYRGIEAIAVDVEITPPDYTSGSFLDGNAPDALYFYNLVKANCDGQETP